MTEQSGSLLAYARWSPSSAESRVQRAADKVAWCRLRYDIALDFGTDEEAAAAAAALQAAQQQQAAQHEAQPRLLGEAGGGEAHYARRPQDEPPAHPRP